MNAHDDDRIDAALEALARPEPPADHVARVLARTVGSGTVGRGAVGRGASLRRPVLPHPWPSLRPRWILPIAAMVFVAIGMTWQLNRQIEREIAAETAGWAQPSPAGSGGAGSRPYQPHGWGAPQEIDRPVLPPQAYWGMDAFEEWNRLRPGARFRVTGTGGASSEVGRGVPPRRSPTAARSSAGAGETPQMAWVPVPSGLPLIELESISPAPLELLPLAPLEDIALTDIPFAPVVITQLAEEERP